MTLPCQHSQWASGSAFLLLLMLEVFPLQAFQGCAFSATCHKSAAYLKLQQYIPAGLAKDTFASYQHNLSKQDWFGCQHQKLFITKSESYSISHSTLQMSDIVFLSPASGFQGPNLGSFPCKVDVLLFSYSI